MVHKAYLEKGCAQKLIERLATQDYCLALLVEVISKINPKSLDVAQFNNIILDLKELKDFMGLSGHDTIRNLKKSIRKIKETVIEFQDGRYWEPVSFFDRAVIDETGYTVHITINKNFIPYITNLKEFLVLSRNVIKANIRSIRLYTFLRSIHKDSPLKITTEQIQGATGTQYPTYGTFKQQLLIPVIADLEKAGIILNYKENKGYRNKVQSLDFSFSEPKDNQDKLLSQQLKQEKESNIKELPRKTQLGYAEPKPNYQPAKITRIEMTDEEREASKQARLAHKPDFIKNIERITEECESV